MTAAFSHERYLPYVDGLRAVSIIAVLGFHVGLPGFPGGFVGVDIFFVISGYLIIGQIATGLSGGSFSTADFFARRVMRILPPMLLVLAAAIIAAPFVLVGAGEYREFHRSAALSALMVVNHYFLRRQGYFDTGEDSKPLLHMWTLSVEEQFYLVAPFVLIGLFWIATRLKARPAAFWTAASIALFALSLASCILLSYKERNPAFYVMPLRAWEFIAGGMLAAMPFSTIGRFKPAATIIGLTGLGLVLFSILGFSANATYPSWRALVPVAGAVMMIAAGMSHPANIVARLLSLRAMTAIGLISYSLYLWHWPLLTFARMLRFGERDLAGDSLVAVIAIALATFTYFAIERPIRQHRRAILTRFSRRGIIAAGTAAAVLVGAAGFSTRYAPGLVGEVRLSGLEMIRAEPPAEPELRGLLLGDSHALVSHPALQERAALHRAALQLRQSASCPALVGTMLFADGEAYPPCNASLARTFREIEKGKDAPSDFVILQARWNRALGLPATDPLRVARFSMAPDGAEAPAPDQFAFLQERLGATLEFLFRHGIKRVLVIGQTPEFTREPADCVARALRSGRDTKICAAPRVQIDARTDATSAALAAAAARFPGVRYIDPRAVFCDTDYCYPNMAEVMLYLDDDHLSTAGVRRLIGQFEPDFRWLLTGSAEIAAETTESRP
ncbi:MAG: acyltransferase [Rhodobiaceae bacterium]|nr:acyltransferase [Rhodobiaceae bacterium]MCC0056358.1 acyltransferase [Rhodobiaceae bacterium]